MTGFVFRIIFKNVQSKMRKFLFQNLSDSCFMLRFRVNLYKFQKFVNQPILIDVNHLLLCLLDRKSTRLNSSHVSISYAVFCLKKKKKNTILSFYYHT